MKNNLFNQVINRGLAVVLPTVDRRSNYTSSTRHRVACILFVLFFAIPQMWGADMPYFSAIAANSSTKTPLSNVSAASSAGGKASVMVTKCTTDNSYVTFTLNSDVKSVFNNGANSIFLCFSVDKDIQMSLCRSSNSNLKVVAYNDGSKISEIESPVLMTSSSNFFSFKAGYTYYISTTSTSGNSFGAVRAYFKKMDDGTNVTVSGWWVESLPKAQTIITLDKNEGNANSSVSATKGESLPTFTAVTRDGYDLTGYFTSVTDGTKVINAEGTLVASTTYTDANAKWNSEVATLTLYAQWKVAAAKHDVIFNHGDGSGNMASVKVSEGAEYALPACTFTAPDGKEFEKWTVDNGIGDKAVGDKFVMPTTDVTATAQWFVNPCKAIGYGTDVAFTKGAANGNLSITSVGGTWETGKTPFKDATSSNWCKASSGSNYITGSFGGKSIATLTVSAATSKTDANKVCAVAFSSESTFDSEKLLEVSEGKTVHLYDVNHTSGERSIIELTAPAGAKSFALGRNFSFGAADGDYKNSGDRYFYYIAACMAEEHTVSFEKGDEDASGSMDPVQVAEGSEYTIPACKFGVPEGKEFDKWTSSDVTITDGKFTMPASDVTLSATWKTATQKWIVTYMDGETTLGTETVEDGAKATKYSDYESKPLSEFKGWFNAESQEIDFNEPIVADLIAYGKWEKAYAQTANFVEAATGTKPDISTFLSGLNYAISSMDNVSWDDQPTAQADRGLKIEKSGTTLSFWVEADKRVKIKVGTLEGVNKGTAGVSVDGGASYETIYGADPQGTGEPKEYTYTTTEETLFVIKINNGCPGTGGVYQWNLIQSISITGTTPHDITLNPATNGSFTVKGLTEGVTAVEGENVALVANPDPHYGLKEWSVYKTGDTETKVTVNNNSFVMPAYDVTVAATFELVTSTDATLSDLKVDGTTVAGFSSDKYEYNVELPYKSTDIPEVTATKNNEFASDPVITQATSLPGTATVKVTAEDETTIVTYTVNFTIAPKDGVCLIKGQVTGQNTVTITVGEGTGAASAVKNTSTYGEQTGYKLNSRPAYIGITLAEGQFQAGDVVNVFVTSVAVGNDGNNPVYQPMRVFSNNTTDNLASCLLVEKESNMVQGVNTVVLPEGCNTNTIYLCRGGADKTYDGWNPYIAYIEVLRPMMPQLTKLVINEFECTKGEGNAFSVTLPNGTDLTNLTVTPTIIANGGEHGEIQGSWAWGDNTYRVLDKDGDYTDYTVTLTEDELKYKVSFDTKGGEPAIEDQYVLPNGYPTAVENPAKEHFAFKGWSESDGGTTAVEITSFQITEDKTFYAIWNEMYMVTFDSKGGTIIDSREIEKGEKVGEVADPEKWDNTFAGWNKQGSSEIIANIAEEVVSSAVTYEANWGPEAGVIKLIDAAGNLNTTDFITGATMQSGTIEYKGVDLNFAKLGGGASDVSSIGNNIAKAVIYNATTTETKIKLVVSNTSTSTTVRKAYIYSVEEGSTSNTKLGEISLEKSANGETEYLVCNSDKRRSIYVVSDSYSHVAILQIKVIESGEPLVKVGEPDYSLNMNKGRMVIASGKSNAQTFEGVSFFNVSSNYSVISGASVVLTASTGRCAFTVENDITLSVTTNGTKKYYVSKSEEGTDNETTPTANVANSFDLTAGTWYIRATSGGVGLTNIAFAKPNAPKPEITAISEGTYCEGGDMPTLTVNATVASGNLHYQWYKNGEEFGTDAATCTPDEDATYYVVVTNKKEGYNDATEQSETVEVKSVAGTSIESTSGARDKAGEQVTISVTATGKNCIYAWYACDEIGTISGDKLGELATLEVTVGENDTYYIIKVNGDCGTEQSAIVKVETWKEVSQVSISGNTVWNLNTTECTDAAIRLTSETTPKKAEECVMANIYGVKNNSTFNSAALLFSGEWIYRGGQDAPNPTCAKYFKFNTTVPGMVTVTFSDNGSNGRHLDINGQKSEASSNTSDVKTFSVMVDAGDVMMQGEESGGTQNYIRFYKIEFHTFDYTRAGSIGGYGTICLPNDVKVANTVGADFFEINYIDEATRNMYFDQVTETLTAGKAYLMEFSAKKAAFVYEAGEPLTNALEAESGFQGVLDEDVATVSEDRTWYGIYGTKIQPMAIGVTVPTNKAYIVLSEVPTEEQTSTSNAPRRICFGMSQVNTPTGGKDVFMQQGVHKFIRNNQMFILREGRLYNAQGKMMR